MQSISRYIEIEWKTRFVRKHERSEIFYYSAITYIYKEIESRLYMWYINLHCKGTACINVNHIRSVFGVFTSKICNYFVKSLLDQLRVNIVSEWHGEKSIAVSRGQLCSTFEFPTRAMTLGATARSRLWSRVGSKLMDWSAVHFLVKDSRVELLILRKYV